MKELFIAIHLDEPFEPFKSEFGIWYEPNKYKDGYYLSTGCEEELIKRNIYFTHTEIEREIEIEE